MSSALRFPLAVSEQSGDNRGIWSGAELDAAVARGKQATP
jgi:hypothetical protein